jgi:hypothetical protein
MTGIMKRLALLVVLLGLLGGAFYGYFAVVNSPQYALVDLAQAVETQDYAEFDKRVNIDSVVGRIMDKAIGEEVKRMEGQPHPQGLFGTVTRGIGAGLIQLAKPAMVTDAVKRLKREFHNPDNAAQVKDLGQKATTLMLTRQAGAVTLQGPTCQAGTCTMVLTDAEKTPYTLELKQAGLGGWEVTAIDAPSHKLAEWLGKTVVKPTVANTAKPVTPAAQPNTSNAEAATPDDHLSEDHATE